MRRTVIVVFLVLIALRGFGQASMMFVPTFIKPYTIALTFTNPASAMSKYGATAEYRRGRWAYTFSRYNYTGVYAGKAYDFGFRHYLRKQWRHEKNQWAYQDFFYWRTLFGESVFQPGKFEFLGLPNYGDEISSTTGKLVTHDSLYSSYLGMASGFGRRYQKGIFFITVRAGLKATYLGLEEDDKIYHRLFYITGPGSIVEVNANFGIQF